LVTVIVASDTSELRNTTRARAFHEIEQVAHDLVGGSCCCFRIFLSD